MPIAAHVPSLNETPPPIVADTDAPVVTVEIAFADDPLTSSPTWSDVSAYVREWSTQRGRSFEYDRPEAGTMSLALSNRDRRFDPDYASGPYYPNVKPTRRARVRALWNAVTYPILQAFTEGFPQDYTASGYDATVAQHASDWFYPLNAIKFTPGTTTLATAVSTAPVAGTVEPVTVTSTALPMPQAFPFTIQVGNLPDVEHMTVLSLSGVGEYQAERGANNTVPIVHDAGVPVVAREVRFPEELSGDRINNCLDMLGVAGPDRNIDDGNALIAESVDLSGQTILEHMLLVAEAENGRLFAAKDGTVTFRQRHRQFTQELSSSGTFGNGAGEVPYQARGVRLSHDDSKLYNHVRVTIADGTVLEAEDQASIDAHFRRTLDKDWPLASAAEGQAAADYMLSRLKQAQLRFPTIVVTPTTSNSTTVWPVVLGAEIGQRFTFTADPPVAGGEIVNTDVIVERIGHGHTPSRWDVAFEFSEADPTLYWRVGVTGVSEIGETTITAY